MVLIKFRGPHEASTFLDTYDNKPYSGMLLDEICHVIRISSVEIKTSAMAPYTFAFPQHGLEFADSEERDKGLSELPTCPVCLE